MTDYPVYRPRLGALEKVYVNQCLDEGWISSRGAFVGRFEEEFAKFTKAAHATTVSNGTVALHLALAALDLPQGSEVIVPSFTYVASVNMIVLAGLVPVFADSLAETWQVDPEDVARRVTPKTSAIMAVHLYGHPCDMDAIQAICSTNDLKLIEDCAEAAGSLWNGQHVGTFGDVGTFSFFGNKTLTTGEGGMLVFRDAALHARAAHLKSQAVSPDRMYWHDEVGYNYRMTNIAAAIGCAQMEGAADVITKKRQIAQWYYAGLDSNIFQFHNEVGPVFHSYWMVSVLLPKNVNRDAFMAEVKAQGVDTRLAFYPVHTMPMYENDGAYGPDDFPVATDLAARGLNLPSYPDLEETDVAAIVEILNTVASDLAVSQA